VAGDMKVKKRLQKYAWRCGNIPWDGKRKLSVAWRVAQAVFGCAPSLAALVA